MLGVAGPPSTDFPALRRVLPFTLPYRMHMAVRCRPFLSLRRPYWGSVKGCAGSSMTGSRAATGRRSAALIGVVVLLAGSTFCRFYLVSWIGECIVADIRRAVFDRVIALSPTYFEVHHAGDILSRLITDTTVLQTIIGSTVSQALRNALLLVGGLAMLAVTSIKLTLLVLLIVPVVIVPILFYGRRVRRLSRDSQDAIAAFRAYAEETINAISAVQAFTHEAIDRARFGARVETAFAVTRRRITARAVLAGLVILLAFGAITLVLWIGGRDVLAGRISAGDLSAFVFYALVVAMAVGTLSEVWGEVRRAAGAAAAITELLDSVADINAPPAPVALPDPARGVVSFEDVGFC
jgi:ATP-binding cassette, subfamily B, bacterial